MDKGILSIKGERTTESKEEGERFTCMERSRGVFYRRLPLPDSADLTRSRHRPPRCWRSACPSARKHPAPDQHRKLTVADRSRNGRVVCHLTQRTAQVRAVFRPGWRSYGARAATGRASPVSEIIAPPWNFVIYTVFMSSRLPM